MTAPRNATTSVVRLNPLIGLFTLNTLPASQPPTSAPTTPSTTSPIRPSPEPLTALPAAQPAITPTTTHVNNPIFPLFSAGFDPTWCRVARRHRCFVNILKTVREQPGLVSTGAISSARRTDGLLSLRCPSRSQ